jgi:hypothetical protein
MSSEGNVVSDLEFLCRALIKAKYHEDVAKQERIQLEERIASLVPGPEVGSKTHKVNDSMKVTVERGYNYKADLDAIVAALASDTEPELIPVKVKTTRELDAKGYEWYKANDNDTYAKICQYVSVTPKKVAVTVKVS